MMMTVAWIVIFSSIGLALLKHWEGATKLEQLPRAFPLGLAVGAVATLMLWMGNVPVTVIAPLLFVFGLVAFWYVFHGRTVQVDQVPLIRNRVTGMLNLHMWWGEALLWTIVAFSLVVTAAWQIFSHPVIWDALVLYDFRALRLAEGWLPLTFMQQFPGAREFSMYDFLHPFFTSIIGSLSYSLGGSHPAIFALALQLTVLWRATQVFVTRQARLVFAVLFMATPIFITAAVEGYAVWYAVLFWLHMFLLLWQRTRLQKHEWLTLGLFLSAAMQSRMSEPYWWPFLLWVFWRYRPTLSSLLSVCAIIFIPFAQFHALVRTAAAQAIAGGSLSSYVPDQYSAELILGIPTAIVPAISALVLHSPFLLFLSFLVVMCYFRSSTRLLEIRDWLMLIGLWLGLLLVGMVGLYALSPSYWPEAVLSLPRAALPLIALIVVVCAGQVASLTQPEK